MLMFILGGKIEESRMLTGSVHVISRMARKRMVRPYFLGARVATLILRTLMQFPGKLIVHTVYFKISQNDIYKIIIISFCRSVRKSLRWCQVLWVVRNQNLWLNMKVFTEASLPWPPSVLTTATLCPMIPL